MRKKTAGVLLLAIMFLILVYWFYPKETSVMSPVVRDLPSEKVKEESPLPSELPLVEEGLAEGVSEEFYDSEEVQVGWMTHGLEILNTNLPDFATAAKTENVFFHRGFKGRPVVCGSVEFYRDDTLVMDFQRFIYPGLKVIYYENETRNFGIYWDKVCEQTSDDYLPN